MDTALSEISLVFFTAIAPAGAIGYLVMALAIIATKETSRAEQISHYLVIPLVLTISGLIASATHLGTPANALYVITGIGRSPLSNEVIAAVVFLVFGGIYWIVSFRDDLKRSFRIGWLVPTMISALVFVTSVALAYSVPSIPTWNLPTAALTLWLSALSSGPIVAVFTLYLAKAVPSRKMAIVVMIITTLAAAANVLTLMAKWSAFADIVTTTARAVDLFPAFPTIIAGYGICETIAIMLFAWATLKPKAKTDDPFAVTTVLNKDLLMRMIALGLSCLLTLSACFAVRFAFYATYMTLGVQ